MYRKSEVKKDKKKSIVNIRKTVVKAKKKKAIDINNKKKYIHPDIL